MDQPAVQFSEVRFGYGGSSEPVFRELSFSIEEGGYAGIVGGNGSGKTTALRLLLGLLRPSEGDIRLFGTPIGEFSAWESVGYVPQYVFQREREFPATVREIVESGHAPGTESISCRFGMGHCHSVDEALRVAEIEHLADRLIGELSGGERQRVFIARALVSNPRLLVLDEPTANIDVVSQEKFFAFLAALNRSGMTIVLVSHDLDTVFDQTKTVFSLENGSFRRRKSAESAERHIH